MTEQNKTETSYPLVILGTKYLSFKDMHLVESLHMDNDPHRFVLHMHFRGRGAHIDHRWVRERKGHILDGMTIAAMKPGITRKPVTSLATARELGNNPALWKISDKAGPFRMFAESKKPEPYEWLTYEGTVEPGEVGATKEEYGVFYIWDRGVQFYGAQKPYFKEFFLQGSKLKGRLIYRLIERRKPPGVKSAFLWLCGKPIDQTPYVLTRRAQKDNWIPPWNVTCLPPEIIKQIPDDYKYWLQKDTKQRLIVRNKLLDALKQGSVKIEYEGLKLESDITSYVLQYKYWKKRTLIRIGPSEEQFALRIKHTPEKCLTFTMEENPLLVDQSAAKLSEEDVSWMKRKGYVAPGQPGNPTPDTPAFISFITQGKAVIVQSSTSFYKLQFLSGGLKGLWVAKQELGGTLWTLMRSALPEVK